jgi:hypothetical protein
MDKTCGTKYFEHIGLKKLFEVGHIYHASRHEG